jgi:Mg/Co/Ni transporter MgtE
MQTYEAELEKAIVLFLFIPVIMSSGGNSGSQATSLVIRALAVREVHLHDWWRVILRELPAGITLGAILGVLGTTRIAVWQGLGLFDYGPHWMLVALTIALSLVGIVIFGSLAGAILPFILRRLGFDPAAASAPFNRDRDLLHDCTSRSARNSVVELQRKPSSTTGDEVVGGWPGRLNGRNSARTIRRHATYIRSGLARAQISS